MPEPFSKADTWPERDPEKAELFSGKITLKQK